MPDYQPTLANAQQQDQADSLRPFRDQFLIPERDGKTLTYLCGNSLGLQPQSVRQALEHELNVWQNHGVEGWFEGEEPWLYYHKYCKKTLADVVGAKLSEVCPMNNLTVNLHLMLTSFFRPKGTRTQILTVAGDFPSDQYALETHVRSRGFDPAETILEIKPEAQSYTLETEQILDAIREHQGTLALVMMSGLHYYTGQVFDMKAIAAEARKYGIRVGFDLAHAAGNAPLHLHDWGVDFAIWCSYKYLNSGPGGVSGIFVHEKNHDKVLPRLAGWWGYDEARRFEMTQGFVPMSGADGWQLSTPTILALAVHRASLAIFAEAGIGKLREKSIKLTGYLEFLIRQINEEFGDPITIMTPADPAARGCQLSLLVEKNGKKLFDTLVEKGIIGDWREPNCIRLAPTPLYNSFEDVWRVGVVIREFFERQDNACGS
jgi:kynureninase